MSKMSNATGDVNKTAEMSMYGTKFI